MIFLKNLHRIAGFTLIGLVVLFLDSAFADAPKAAVEQLLATITQLHHKKPLTEEQRQSNDKISRQALRFMFVRRVSEKTLGKYWKERSKKEQDEFVQLLGDIFRFVAFPNSAKFFGEMDISYAATRMEGKTATVPMTVVHKEEGEVGIDFVLAKTYSKVWIRHPGENLLAMVVEGDPKHVRWLVVDVILDGVSMRTNLRTQFYKVIKKKDYPELLRRMQKKLNSAKK